QNTSIGQGAMGNLTTGSQNTSIGFNSAAGLTTGTGNVYIGNSIGALFANESGVTKIINIRGKTTQSADAVAVLIDSNNGLGTTSSLRAKKENIQDVNLNDIDKLINSFKTYKFNMIGHPADRPQWGMMVDDLVDLCPDLVSHNKDGEPEAIMWHYIPHMLIAHNQYLTKRINSLEDDNRQLDQMNKQILK